MKIIKIVAGYHNHVASQEYVYIRVNLKDDVSEQAFKEDFYKTLVSNREAYIKWWGWSTVYGLGRTLATTVQDFQQRGYEIELIQPEDTRWYFEFRGDIDA